MKEGLFQNIYLKVVPKLSSKEKSLLHWKNLIRSTGFISTYCADGIVTTYSKNDFFASKLDFSTYYTAPSQTWTAKYDMVLENPELKLAQQPK